MSYTTIGSIRSFKIEGTKLSITIKGIADYSTKIESKDYLTLVEKKTPQKQIDQETFFEVSNDIQSMLLVFISEALKNKVYFKYTLEYDEGDASKNMITAIENYDERNKMA
ncbi:MAG: hypothetical protein CVU50_00085 [Candidatus Cloacimonetes bacterium HGW-Cloacimonetes-3]|jgi:hypothetical protein|nr:MAG: hypothetical protein CVU50_00085 [Candidatus Cloacimonetes bacterium HGW-Cloacimonetes-3]